MKRIMSGLILSGLLVSVSSYAEQLTVKMYKTVKKGRGAYVGNIVFVDTQKGVLIKPHLFNLPKGQHGFHVHVVPSCANKGLAAKGHYDPEKTGKHLGPYRQGHLGDLPVLQVNKSGKTTMPLLAPRLQVKALKRHAIMIHAGGDNYSDSPKPLGGGGARIACGVVK